RPTSLSPDNILRFLQVTNGGATLEAIQRALRLAKSDRRPLVRMLAKLKKKQVIEEFPGGRFLLAGRRGKGPSGGSGHPESARRGLNEVRQGGSSQAQSLSGGRNSLSGRLILHQDGYGFVVPDRPVPNLNRDIFVPRDAAGDAMHGDHVLVELGRISPGPDGQRAEGRIVRILDRAHPTVVGLFRYTPSGNVVLPYDNRIQHQVQI